MDENKLARIEQMLRDEPGVALSPEFKRKVLAAVARFPRPELTAPPAGLTGLRYATRLLSPTQLVVLVLMALGLAGLLLPGASDLLTLWNWKLADLQVSLSFGEQVVSASLLSLIAVAAGLLFMTGIGVYSTRNKLIGA
jgi:hypothetical protein